MKSYRYLVIQAAMLMFCACAAIAADLGSLDRVTMLMSKSQVASILGIPDKVADMDGLMVDLYLVNQAEPLLSAGYFYGKDSVLAGHVLIFRGDVAARTAARMKEHGFISQMETGEYIRLAGKDDDTGHPVVVTISRIDELTTVTTFEKGFYEQRADK